MSKAGCNASMYKGISSHLPVECLPRGSLELSRHYLRDGAETNIVRDITENPVEYSKLSIKFRRCPGSESADLREISGWGSFEDPEFCTLESLRQPNMPTVALLVSTTKWIRGGFYLGYLVPWHSALNVLYLQNVKGRRYQRIGVGVMYGKDSARRFHDSEITYIELV